MKHTDTEPLGKGTLNWVFILIIEKLIQYGSVLQLRACTSLREWYYWLTRLLLGTAVCFSWQIPLSFLWKCLFLTAATVTCLCGISLVLGPPLTVLLCFQDWPLHHPLLEGLSLETVPLTCPETTCPLLSPYLSTLNTAGDTTPGLKSTYP